VTGRDVAACV